jgi:hypothetical protein
LSVSEELEMCRLRAQRDHEDSPYAEISAPGPKSAVMRGEARIRVTARLKWETALLGEKMSVKRRVATAPCEFRNQFMFLFLYAMGNRISDIGGMAGRRTVATMPASITMRLTDCCVVRAAFSPRLRSLHRTAPVSLVTVTDLRVGWGGGVEELLLVVLCVAHAGLVVESAALVMRSELRGRRVVRKVGRRSCIASIGLYWEAMVPDVFQKRL